MLYRWDFLVFYGLDVGGWIWWSGTKSLPFLWKNNFPYLSQSVPILSLQWKSNPKIRPCVKYFQTSRTFLTWRVPNYMSNVTWPMASCLLPQADKSCIPVQGCNLLYSLTFQNNIDVWFCSACVQKCWNLLYYDYCLKICCQFVIYNNLNYFLG